MLDFHNMLIEGDKCVKCVNRVEGGEIEDHEIKPASRTCFECFRCTCEDCNNNDFNYGREIRDCLHCGLTFCENHGGSCYNCAEFWCSACTEIDTVGSTKTCENQHCYRQFCLDCIDNDDCKCCLGRHFPALHARKSEQEAELRGEINQLRSDKSDLAEENEELRREIEELRKKMSSGLGILS